MFFKLNSSIFSAPCHPEHSLMMHTGLGARDRLVPPSWTEEQGGSYRTRHGVLWWTCTQDSGVGTWAAAVFTCLWVEPVLSFGKRTAERNVWMNEWLFWITPQIPWSSVSVTGMTPTLRMVSSTPPTPASLICTVTPERSFCHPLHAEPRPRRTRAKKGSSYSSGHLGTLVKSWVCLSLAASKTPNH